MQVGDYRGYLKRNQFWGTLPGEAVQRLTPAPAGLSSRHGQGCPARPSRPGGRLEVHVRTGRVEPHALTDFDKEVDALRADPRHEGRDDGR